jgi:hypothetical protein
MDDQSSNTRIDGGLSPAKSTLTEEGVSFLERDFNQCFFHLRHYNTLSFELLKFTGTFYTTIIGVSVGLYQFSTKERVDLTPVASAILGCSLLIGMLLFLVIVRNRENFVIVARYINEHRHFFLKQKPLGFENTTGMYTCPTRPRFFNWRSVDILYVYAVGLLNGMLMAGLLWPFVAVSWAIGGGVTCTAILVGGARIYLSTRSAECSNITTLGD